MGTSDYLRKAFELFLEDMKANVTLFMFNLLRQWRFYDFRSTSSPSPPYRLFHGRLSSTFTHSIFNSSSFRQGLLLGHAFLLRLGSFCGSILVRGLKPLCSRCSIRVICVDLSNGFERK
ncbi:hypothetical protein SDJN03_22320, partial [Cucurbita argyrosperma subsp. sororia]